MKDRKGLPSDSRIPVLSFFTGGGFLDMGFEQAGFHVKWTNEVDPAFSRMYAYGMSHWRQSEWKNAPEASITTQKNIERLFAAEIMRAAFPSGKPAFFGMLGGPPCPDFSTGGVNRGGKGLNGRLSKTYVHRICQIQPAFFVFENVAGLFRTKIHREFLAGLERTLEREKYCLDLKILNALELGVPQDRERLIMIGINQKVAQRCLNRRISTDERNWFPWPVIKEYANAKSLFDWPDIVLNGEAPGMPQNVLMELTTFSVLGPDNSPIDIQNGRDTFNAYSNKFLHVREGDTKRKSFKRLHRYRYSPTACYGNNEVHLHPWENRRLSVREAMRLQGIPDTYVLPDNETLTKKFAMVSNGVPVPLAREVAKILHMLFTSGNVA